MRDFSLDLFIIVMIKRFITEATKALKLIYVNPSPPHPVPTKKLIMSNNTLIRLAIRGRIIFFLLKANSAEI